MPINFTTFEQQLTNYFSSRAAQSEADTAKTLTTLYAGNILQGSDLLYNNPISSYNKEILQKSLENAFNIARTSGTTSHFPSMISQGLIGFWTGATLANLVPPPGSIAVISNFVNNPGTPQSFQMINATDASIISRNLIIIFKLHLGTVGGITTATVPTPSGPVPTPFPWQGFA